MNTKDKVVVLVSGGMDSACCLRDAFEKFDRKNVSTLTFYYGQRHKKELYCAVRMCEVAQVPFQLVDLSEFFIGLDLNSSLLNHEKEIGTEAGDIPNTFVRGRNLVFLLYAWLHCQKIGANFLVTGVCQADYSGYPDCREDTLSTFASALFLGTSHKRILRDHVFIETPLMHITKAQALKKYNSMELFNLLRESWSCYVGGEKPCGTCPSCKLRAAAFEQAGMEDPAL